MSEDARIAIEDAARILGTGLEKLLIKTFELGIRIQLDRASATDYTTKSDLEDLRSNLCNRR
jgi:hypothetical protein